MGNTLPRDFRPDYLLRLPLPLAQLYSRSYNAKGPRERHDSAFRLFEAAIKLTASVLVAAYGRALDDGADRQPNLDQLLSRLARPQLGHWVALMREFARHFAEVSARSSHPLGHLEEQLGKPRVRCPGILGLFRRIKNGPDGQPAGDQSCSVRQIFDALVQYRNIVMSHGAERNEAFYAKDLGPLLFAAANELLEEGFLDILGPSGTRLIYLSERRALNARTEEIARKELLGLQSVRLDPVILETRLAATLVPPSRIALQWPGVPLPVPLDPFLLYRENELTEDVLFLNGEGGVKGVNYLSYTTGKWEWDVQQAESLQRFLDQAAAAAEPEISQAEPSTSEGSAPGAAGPGTRALVEAPAAATPKEFEILAEIGRGGMGVVYLARQLSLGRYVALKMLPAELTEHEVALARFRREIRALGRCDHPNVVKVLSTGHLPDGRLYYAMEYVPGADLEHVWRELSGMAGKAAAATLGGTAWTTAVLTASRKQREQAAHRGSSSHSPFGEPQPRQPPVAEPATLVSEASETIAGQERLAHDASVCRAGGVAMLLPPLPEAPRIDEDAEGANYTRRVAMLVRDAARALEEVHRQGIVHRDVKPSNLILTPDGGRVVLMDFGLAKGQSVTMAASRHAGFLGTLRYAAPEQLASSKLIVGPAADVRGLGVTAWELLTRRRLFDEAEDESRLASWVLNRDLPRLRAVDPSLDKDLEAIIARATERDAANRIQRAGELADYLDLYLHGKPIPLRTPGAGELLWRWFKQHKAAVAAVCTLIVGLVVLVAHQAQQRLRAAELRALRASLELAHANLAVTPEHWNRVESILARMAAISPDEAANSRQDYVRLFAERLERLINEQPRQDPGAERQFAQAVLLVRGHIPERAKLLEEALARYQKRPMLILDLDEAGLKRAEGKSTFVTGVGAPGELEVELSLACDDWSTAAASLVLDFVPGKKFTGYRVTLLGRAAQPPAPFERLRILRDELVPNGDRLVSNDLLLRESELALQGGTITLIARRTDTALEVRLGDAGAPLRFRDVVPLERNPAGVIAWSGSQNVRATRLRVSRFAAERRSPLEEGDSLLAEGKFSEGLKFYEQLITTTNQPELRQELLYKQARCYLGLRDEKSAIRAFDDLMHQEGELWPALAACDLCLLRLKSGHWDQADVALARLPHFIPEADSGAILFDRLFGQIIRPYVDDRREVTRQMRLKPAMIERLVALFEVSEKLSELPRIERLDVLVSLSDACISVGQERLAERLLDRMLAILGDWRKRPLDDQTAMVIAYVAHARISLLIRAKRLEEAGAFMQSLQPIEQFPAEPRARLQLEQARVLAARGDVDQARSALQWVLELNIRRDDMRVMGSVGTAALLRGFLAEDEDQARAIWNEAYQRLKGPETAGALVVAMLGSLSRAMTDEDARQMIKTVAGSLGSQFPQATLVAADFIGASEIIPALQDMWAFGRGRQTARDFALGRLSGNDVALTQIPLTVAEIIRKGAFGGMPSAEIDEMLWETMVTLFRDYRDDKLSLFDGTKLFMVWSGKLAWSSAAPRLEARMSARIAYFAACHLRRMNRPNDARLTFLAALKLATGDQQLERLIHEELAALGSGGR